MSLLNPVDVTKENVRTGLHRNSLRESAVSTQSHLIGQSSPRRVPLTLPELIDGWIGPRLLNQTARVICHN